MIGWLVKKKNVRCTCQDASECRTARFAARKLAWGFIAREAELAKKMEGPVCMVDFGKAGLDVVAGCGESREVRLLMEICDRGVGLCEAGPAVGCKQTG